MNGAEFIAELEALKITRREFATISGFAYNTIMQITAEKVVSKQLEASLNLVKRIKELENQVSGLKALIKG